MKTKLANKTRSLCKKKAETSNGVVPFNESSNIDKNDTMPKGIGK